LSGCGAPPYCGGTRSSPGQMSRVRVQRTLYGHEPGAVQRCLEMSTPRAKRTGLAPLHQQFKPTARRASIARHRGLLSPAVFEIRAERQRRLLRSCPWTRRGHPGVPPGERAGQPGAPASDNTFLIAALARGHEIRSSFYLARDLELTRHEAALAPLNPRLRIVVGATAVLILFTIS
jgi:hypothetical protein